MIIDPAYLNPQNSWRGAPQGELGLSSLWYSIFAKYTTWTK